MTTAPLVALGHLGERGDLAAALAIGVAFGWCLERAGLGSARRMMAQFDLTDLVVFKVMFSAIVTALLGTFWLARLGVLELGLVHVPETFLLPQLAGGLIFGAGLAIAGLCPGTSCVAAVTGRVDGMVVATGFLAGVLATGVTLPALGGFFTSTALGALTLPALLRVPYGAVVLLVVGAALSGFALAPRIERRRERVPA